MPQNGEIVRNKRTGEMGVFQDGQVMPMQQQPQQNAVIPPDPRRVQSEQEDKSRKNREESYDRGDRTFDEAKKFRDEFRSLTSTQNYNVALGTFNSSLKTASTPEGDQSLITAYARMMDPNSVVREGEFATAAGNEAAFKQLRTKFAKEFGLEGAGRLTDEGRSRLRDEMRNLVVERFKLPYDLDRQQYEKFAQMQGLDPYLITGENPIKAFSPAFRAQLTEAPETTSTLADAGADVAAKKLPPEYQKRHFQYLQENWGNLDPQAYADFRTGLDREFEQNPNPQAYSGAVAGFNELANLGGTPDQLGLVPDAEEPAGFMNGVAQFEPGGVPVGAFATNMANAGSFGLAGALSGGQDKLEAMREESPWGSGLGELAGGVTGTMGAGKLLGAITPSMGGGRAASILANPLTADVAYGTTYGATQDTENPFRGALVGAGGAFVGNQIGKQIGKVMPSTFAGGAMRQADEAVPSNPELRMKAADQYQAVENAGIAADPQATTQLRDTLQGVLQTEGRISPAGRLIDTDTPVTRAYGLINDFAGEPMTPTQAGSVRGVLSEGLMATKDGAPDNSARRLTGKLIDEFDQWADPTLPGVADARQTASRYLQGEEIDRAIEMGNANSEWYSQSGLENSLRSAFRGLDKEDIRGQSSFSDEVTGQIQKVTRGTPVSNAARNMGKYAPTSPMAMATGGGAIGAMAGGLLGAGAGAVVGGGVSLAGAIARKAATAQTKRAAEVASLMARGGPEYQQAYRDVIELAGNRGGNFGAGMFGTLASNRTR